MASTNLALDHWPTLEAPPELQAQQPPVIDTEIVPRCPVCGDTRFAYWASGFDYEMLTCMNPWRFVRCQCCEHVWLNPRPALTALPTIYPPHYYAYQYQEQISLLARWAKEVLDRLKLKGILRRCDNPPCSFLDIGCGDGRFLRTLERMGLSRSNLYGLELDRKVVQPLAAAGYRVYCERVEECKQIAAGSIDLATMFHVIEHVDDPGSVVAQVAAWLSPRGVFAIETPNLDSLDARLFQNRYWGGYHIPRHWNLFTPTTLSRLLTERGLEIVEVRYQTGHSFWLWSIHHWLRFHVQPWPRIARLFNPFRGLPFLIAATALDKVRAAIGFRTSAMLIVARKASRGSL